LRINLEKSEFFRDKVVFLEHLISHEKIQIDPSRIEGIASLH